MTTSSMHGFRVLIVTLLIGAVIGIAAWYVISMWVGPFVKAFVSR